jgi:hypothetical protein
MALIQKAFSDIITFSRSSNATRIGPTGLVEYAPHNLLTYSEHFDNAAWLKSNSSITANAIAAPDGTITADSVIENSSVGLHGVYPGVTITANIPYTYSVYLKAGTRSYLRMYIVDNSGSHGVYADVNLASGVISAAVAIGTGGSAASSITSVGNGWYRCSLTGTPNGGITSITASLYMQQSYQGSISYTGDGASGLYLWGAQLAVGPYALDYTPTTSAAVYGPRFDFDPVTLAPKGLLVEEQRTNLILQSNVGNIGTNWQQYGTAVLTQNYSAAPDGTVSAGRLATTTSGTVRVLSTTLTNGTTYAASIWMKSNTASSYSIDIQIGDNLIGTFTVTPTWQRFSGAGTPLVTGYNFIDLEISNNLDISVWGAQIEQGGFATSLIPTSGSTVTRSADVASVNTLSPWWNASAATFYIENTFGGFGNQPIALADQAAVGNAWIYSSTLGLIKSYTAGAALDLSSASCIRFN